MVGVPSADVRHAKIGGGPAFGLRIFNGTGMPEQDSSKFKYLGGEIGTGPDGPERVEKGSSGQAYLTTTFPSEFVSGFPFLPYFDRRANFL